MTQEYNRYFLEYKMRNFAEACSFVNRIYELNVDAFIRYFISSGYAKEFEDDNPSVIYGQSGIELALLVMEKVGYKTKKDKIPSDVHHLISYWAGYVIAYYQHVTKLSFSYIFSQITFKEIEEMYHPLHEAGEDKFVEVLNEIIKKKIGTTRLQQRRRLVGLSQSELAKYSNVNLRTLQQYEIGSKDINKASISTVLSLSKALECNVEDILEMI